MSTPLAIVLAIGVTGFVLYVGRRVREVIIQRRNLRHYERDEPLEGGVDKWD